MISRVFAISTLLIALLFFFLNTEIKAKASEEVNLGIIPASSLLTAENMAPGDHIIQNYLSLLRGMGIGN